MMLPDGPMVVSFRKGPGPESPPGSGSPAHPEFQGEFE